jgi:hypothetical protein
MRARRALPLLLCLAFSLLGAAQAAENAGSALQAKYSSLEPELRVNAFGRPVHLESKESSKEVAGSTYAVLSHPFAKVGPALADPANWCEILLLPFNTKQCTVTRAGGQGTTLEVRIGAKNEDTPEQAYPVAFAYRVAESSAEFLQVKLDAEQGPLSTRNYRIVLEAAPLKDGRTFLHFDYSYGFGLSGRLAMQTYLATVGAGKVGFTVLDKASNGEPRYVGGMRGVVERNTMRYYLAIEAFLGALGAARAERTEKAARDWFAATERYRRQLHEMDEAQYLAMKRKEYARQAQAGPRASTAQGS